MEIDLVDLRSCTPPGPVTCVTLHGVPWIRTRRARLLSYGDQWVFDARVKRRAATPNHQIAFAVSLVLTRVRIVAIERSVVIYAHIPHDPLSKWRTDGSHFIVAPQGYDPLATATRCPTCPRRAWHPVVPPVPHDPVLFEKMRGQDIQIEFGEVPRKPVPRFRDESDIGLYADVTEEY